MGSIVIILTCVCIHLLIIEAELLFGLIKIIKMLKSSNDKVESQESEK